MSQKTHGESLKSPEWRAWASMRNRCLNPNAQTWSHYGARGIKIDPRWDDYAAFLADMGRRPGKGYSLDRIDNEGDYTPANCRWATRMQQMQNTRITRIVTFNGRSQSLSGWSRELGIGWGALHRRLRAGWAVDKAFSMPLSRVHSINAAQRHQRRTAE